MQQPQVIFTEPSSETPKKKRRIIKMPKRIALPENEKLADTRKSQKESDEIREQREKIKHLVENSQTILFKCRAIFPFDLFPDEITIEPTQINISKKFFFFTSRANSIPVKNLADAILHTAPFFASLTIVDQNFTENSVTVSYLNKKDAEIARRIIQGLIVMSKEGVDLSKIDVETLRKEVADIGAMQAIKQV